MKRFLKKIRRLRENKFPAPTIVVTTKEEGTNCVNWKVWGETLIALLYSIYCDIIFHEGITSVYVKKGSNIFYCSLYLYNINTTTITLVFITTEHRLHFLMKWIIDPPVSWSPSVVYSLVYRVLCTRLCVSYHYYTNTKSAENLLHCIYRRLFYQSIRVMYTLMDSRSCVWWMDPKVKIWK